MRKRKWLAAGGTLLAATFGLFGAATAASASTTSPVVGYTCVDGNTAGANTVDGFARHADGSLTPLTGSPFAAGGAGLGTGLASTRLARTARWSWWAAPPSRAVELTSTPGCPRTAGTCWSTARACISCPCSPLTAGPSPSCQPPRPRCPSESPHPPESSTPSPRHPGDTPLSPGRPAGQPGDSPEFRPRARTGDDHAR